MSSFIVSPATMAMAVCGINLAEHGNMDAKQQDQLALDCYAMNMEAFCYRYTMGEQERAQTWMPETFSVPGWIAGTLTTAKIGDLCKAVKAVQCLSYQCAESEAIINSPLYQRIEKAERELLHEIVRRLPEYSEAPWDSVKDGTREAKFNEAAYRSTAA